MQATWIPVEPSRFVDKLARFGVSRQNAQAILDA